MMALVLALLVTFFAGVIIVGFISLVWASKFLTIIAVSMLIVGAIAWYFMNAREPDGPS